MSDYLTDEEQLDKLKKWWEENGLMLIGAVVLSVAGVIGWNWYGDRQAAEVAGSSDLYVDYLRAEGTERDTIEATLASEYPDSVYRAFILLRNARAEAENENPEGALTALNEALSVVDDDKLADVIRVRIARVEQELDRSDAALATLGEVRSLGLRSHVQELKGDIHMARGERVLAHEAYSAALEEIGQDAPRPLLELKVSDTADANEA
ncbi:MAG: tetratricopeptide repeat protein [Gammaproteobacteria bacterium]|nr:MAG: tetratricopeptide repeat protein [Gammaproteobacteria bacterium]